MIPLPMTWKSYAIVSGATVLAGWLASAPGDTPPESPGARGPARATASATAVDIEQQAARLQARVPRQPDYHQPARNPFRFGAAEASRSAPAVVAPAPREPEPAAPLAPLPPPLKLAGIAEDPSGDRANRTAVISTPTGVLLVREGDEVLGQYRVASIEAEAVTLIAIGDGSTRRLSLTTANSQ